MFAKDTFDWGKYKGRSHVEVAGFDPHYIIWCYEGCMDNGGVSRETYHRAADLINETADNMENMLDNSGKHDIVTKLIGEPDSYEGFIHETMESSL